MPKRDLHRPCVDGNREKYLLECRARDGSRVFGPARQDVASSAHRSGAGLDVGGSEAGTHAGYVTSLLGREAPAAIRSPGSRIITRWNERLDALGWLGTGCGAAPGSDG